MKVKEEGDMGEEKASGIKTLEPSVKEAKGVAIEAIERNVDPFEVKGGDPKMEYYWGNTRSDRLEQEQWARGFEVCNSGNSKVQTIGRKPDGSHQLGDAILMQRPKELSDRERERIESIRRRRMNSPREEFKAEADRNRVKTIEER